MADPTTPEKTEAQTLPPVADQSKAEEPRIPKERLDQEIRKRNELADALEKLRLENEALKNRNKVEERVRAEPDADLKALRDDVTAIKRANERVMLKNELKLQEDKQVAAVEIVLQENPSLKPAEALMLASARDAELFGGKDPRAFNPGQHGSLRTSGGGPLPAESLKDRAKKVDAIADPVVRQREVQRLFGKEVAKLAGIPRND